MTNTTNDLFIGAVSTDDLTLIGDDEAMFGTESTFAGAESDVLMGGGADDNHFEVEDVLPANDDVDVLSADADSDMIFDVADEGFESDDTDVIDGEVWDLGIAA